MSGSVKVLIVDDSSIALRIHSAILTEAGFACSTAENGYIALERCAREEFRIILTDVNMPKMDGYEFTRKVRTVAGYAQTPIVIVSTEQEAEDKTKGFEAGANVYIVKPVDSEELLAHVRILLG